MIPVSEELKGKLRKLNEALLTSYPKDVLDSTRIRQKIANLGSFFFVQNLPDQELQDWMEDKSLVGVDGSVNSTKGPELRTLSIFQALAKGTKGEEAWKADLYTPLLEEEEESSSLEDGQLAREASKRGAKLSILEMDVAMEAMRKWKPKVVLMDGSLSFFAIRDWEKCNKLMETAQEENVLLIGVSEEIGARRLAKEIYPEYPAFSDRDLLYGVLKEGEAYEWEDWSPSGNGLWKMAVRTSNHPVPISIDGLMAQKWDRKRLADLVYTLTPKQGRGIPFWLDIVDNQVRVTDLLVQGMIDQYIDPELRHRLLATKRNERVI
ncbi:DNA double-strand break repair nuclease NurA [Risungbinella massiliensis]|uniref:DNA double-strand break repair nuclease NurA n=1 Tax=Risungbinella massiliensis TaxID=1329796 RepID=UPI0005CB9B02|nr:DNA double-strand break repair nuclease NurA [Risungbinella massiliensis]